MHPQTRIYLGLRRSSDGAITISPTDVPQPTANRYVLEEFSEEERSSSVNQREVRALVSRFNWQVYETRVARSFLNECLARAMCAASPPLSAPTLPQPPRGPCTLAKCA